MAGGLGSSSSKRRPMRSANAANAASASGPSASSPNREPLPAASVVRSRTLRPLPRRPAAGEVEGLMSVAGYPGVVAEELQQSGQALGVIPVVFDDEDMLHIYIPA